GGATAVTAAVVTSNDDTGYEMSGAVDDDASVDEGVAAHFEDPVVPVEAKPAPVPTKIDANGEPVGTFTSTILEPVPDEDPSAIPGPDVEGF
ncbi:MAG TPA: hypothetical protein VG755_16340, partial [Nannocystaceae bacterium]|nr:hypothetical protein [Nannocystaceae bacterium]